MKTRLQPTGENLTISQGASSPAIHDKHATKLEKFIRKWSKRARMLWRFWLYKIGMDKRAVFAVLTVNAQCNFHCKYCFADYCQREEKPLSTERMLQTIDELADYGVIYLNVHGGEALIRKDIGTIINYALSKKMFVNLITNGALLKRRWDDVKNVDTLCVSMDGREENNDKNRGKGTYKIAVEAIEFALSRGVPVRITMTISQHTKNDIEWIAEWAKQRNVNIHPFLLFDQESLPEELRMTPEENREALRKLVELKKQGYPIFYSLKTLEYAMNWPFDTPTIHASDLPNLQIPKGFKFIQCYYKLLNVLVESDGTVRACNAETRGVPHVSFLEGKTVREAKEELLKQNDCLYCYHLPQMEMSNLMDLRIGPVLGQFISQTKEDIRAWFTTR